MSGAGAICTITQSDDDERSRALNLVAAFWPELQPMVRRWLGTAFDEDDGRVGEVVFLMVRRISGGKGIVPPLRGIRSGDPGVKGLVFANARFVTAEVVRSARGHRRWRSTLTDFAALEIPAPGGLEDVLLDGSIASLLELGDETWKQLCAAGVLDPSDWTEDEKWTAIGMMWDLSARDIATVRYVMAGAPSVVLDDGCRSTYQKVRTVHSRGKRLLATMSAELRRAYGLPPLSALDDGITPAVPLRPGSDSTGPRLRGDTSRGDGRSDAAGSCRSRALAET